MYLEGNVPYVTNGNQNGFLGGEGIWAIVIFAMIFGWGRNGWGNGGNGGSEVLGYELGRVATTNDVASGFSTSTIMGNQRESQLAMQQGFADVQQTLCQGFSGINTSLLTGFHGVDNSVCTLGYNMATGFNSISREIADCCCQTQRALERQTCDLITNANANTQRIMDHLYYKELEAVKAERDDYKLQASQARQTNAIVSALNPQPIPSYTVPNPNCCYTSCNSGIIL